ncbi:MAG: hypothetical protein PHF57_10335 [Methanoregula sp.]|jgi:hypothetical protein|nr:hypothetical protein [Methanoregula sp.]
MVPKQPFDKRRWTHWREICSIGADARRQDFVPGYGKMCRIPESVRADFCEDAKWAVPGSSAQFRSQKNGVNDLAGTQMQLLSIKREEYQDDDQGSADVG